MSKPGRVKYLGELQRLTPEPGDIYILMVPGSLSAADCSRLRQNWHAQIGDEHRLLILSDGMKLGVIGKRPEESAA